MSNHEEQRPDGWRALVAREDEEERALRRAAERAVTDAWPAAVAEPKPDSSGTPRANKTTVRPNRERA